MRMFPEAENKCWKCGYGQGAFIHTWWQCPKVRKCWLLVFRKVKLNLINFHLYLLLEFCCCVIFKLVNGKALGDSSIFIYSHSSVNRAKMERDKSSYRRGMDIKSVAFFPECYYARPLDGVQKFRKQWMMFLEFVSAQEKEPQLGDQVLELL